MNEPGRPDYSDPRLDPRLAPRRTGVVLIDLQNDVVRGSGPFYTELAEVVQANRVVENTARLVDGARTAGCTIFFVTVVRRPDYAEVVNQLTELIVTGKAGPAKRQVSLLRGTRGAQIVDELVPRDEDVVIVKKRRNAFYATDLEFHLRAREIDTLIVGGVATNLGVENTVRDAWDRDYNLIVVPDCCAAYPGATHEYAIESVFPRMARIMTTDQVLAALTKSPE